MFLSATCERSSVHSFIKWNCNKFRLYNRRVFSPFLSKVSLSRLFVCRCVGRLLLKWKLKKKCSLGCAWRFFSRIVALIETNFHQCDFTVSLSTKVIKEHTFCEQFFFLWVHFSIDEIINFILYLCCNVLDGQVLKEPSTKEMKVGREHDGLQQDWISDKFFLIVVKLLFTI